MNELATYLLKNAYIDFSGDISIEQVKQLLRDDDSSEARALLSKLLEDKNVEELILTIADCLKEQLRGGIDEKTIARQLMIYAES